MYIHYGRYAALEGWPFLFQRSTARTLKYPDNVPERNKIVYNIFFLYFH